MPGTRTARNQAVYDERHLQRVRLIRTLSGIGELELSSVREVLATIDDGRVPLAEVAATINRALFPREGKGVVPAPAAEQAEVGRYVEGLSWDNARGSDGPQMLAEVVVALRELGCTADINAFDALAAMAEQLAITELDLLAGQNAGIDRGAAVAHTVLINAAFTVLHRMAHQHHVIRRLYESRDSVAGRDN